MALRPIQEAPIPEDLLAMVDASVARRGTTTADGAAPGNSFIDAGLIGFGVDSFLGMLVVIRPGEPNLIDSIEIVDFNNATGEVDLGDNYKGGQITAGTPYTIITMKGVADTATLEAWVGWEGAASLADKLTAVRAALLDEITAPRMAQLDPAGLEADITAVGLAVLNRALEDGGRLQDTQGAVGAIEGATTLHNKLTAARAAFLDAAISTRAAEDGGRLQDTQAAVGTEAATTLHGKLTAARAALLDEITALRMEQLDPAGLQAGIAAVDAAIAALNDIAATDIVADGVAFNGARIDADISSRAAENGGRLQSTEGAVGAIEGATTLHNKLTAARAARLDADISSRAAEDGGRLQDTQTAVGTEAATTLHGKLTAARAALLDEITAARMEQLDPAGLEADIAAVDAAIAALVLISADDVRQSVCLVGDPANSIGKALFELYVNRLTAVRAAHLDADISSRAVEDGGRLQSTEGAVGATEGATTLHNKLTAVRAALLDEITALRMAQLDPAGLEADINAVGLAILDRALEDGGRLQDTQTAVGTEAATTLHGKLTAARAALLDEITAARMEQLDPAGLQAGIAAVDAAIAALNDIAATDIVADGVAFNGARIDADISSRAAENGGRLQSTEGAVGAIEGATTLHNKLTAARAARLDADISSRAAEDGGRLQDTQGAVGAIEGGTTLHNKLTAARAGYLNNINQAGLLQVTAARAGYLDRVKNLTRTASGAQTITDAAAQVVGAAVEDTVPFKISGFISLHNLQADDKFLVLEEVRDRDDATYREYARYTYEDVQESCMIHFNEKVCQGWRVRMQRTGGANREITYQFFKEVASA